MQPSHALHDNLMGMMDLYVKPVVETEIVVDFVNLLIIRIW